MVLGAVWKSYTSLLEELLSQIRRQFSELQTRHVNSRSMQMLVTFNRIALCTESNVHACSKILKPDLKQITCVLMRVTQQKVLPMRMLVHLSSSDCKFSSLRRLDTIEGQQEVRRTALLEEVDM